MDTHELTREIGENAAKLNSLIAKLPSDHKVEIDVTEAAYVASESIQRVSVTIYKRLGGNRAGKG